jgi:hypothetical protein
MKCEGRHVGGISFASVPGTSGKYIADSEGDIYGPRAVLKPASWDEGSHQFVSVTRDGRKQTQWVHRTVWEAFHGNIPAGSVIRHLDGDPQNNRLSNLAIGTPADNAADRDAHGTTARGERHGMSKLSADQVRDIRSRRSGGERLRSIAADFDVTETMVSYIARGLSWRHV